MVAVLLLDDVATTECFIGSKPKRIFGFCTGCWIFEVCSKGICGFCRTVVHEEEFVALLAEGVPVLSKSRHISLQFIDRSMEHVYFGLVVQLHISNRSLVRIIESGQLSLPLVNFTQVTHVGFARRNLKISRRLSQLFQFIEATPIQVLLRIQFPFQITVFVA